MIRQTTPDHIRRYKPELPFEPLYQGSVVITPSRITMQQNDNIPGTLIDIMHAMPINMNIIARKRKVT